ncbi:MAG: ferritin-like domain-containing protein [Gemmatimonadaceae bacterium]
MDNQTILDTIDPEIAGRMTRRDALLRGAALTSGAAATVAWASMPLALATMAKGAFAQGGLPANIIAVLNFALTLEYLEAEFYNRGAAAPGLIPAADFQIFDQIRKHENAHVNFLLSVLGNAAVPKPTFDFTAGNGSGNGPFVGVFSNYEIFKAVSQAFEDTGVRAYKGQAPNLISNKAILTAALRIHSVEARHAAEVRKLRGVTPWIQGNQTDIPGTQMTYAGEENTVQLGIDLVALVRTTLPQFLILPEGIAAAFDEPLTAAQVLAIVDPFIV